MIPNIEAILSDYPEILYLCHLEQIFGLSPRTIQRRRAAGKYKNIAWSHDEDGKVCAYKSTVVEHLRSLKSKADKEFTPPSIEEIRAA